MTNITTSILQLDRNENVVQAGEGEGEERVPDMVGGLEVQSGRGEIGESSIEQWVGIMVKGREEGTRVGSDGEGGGDVELEKEYEYVDEEKIDDDDDDDDSSDGWFTVE